MQIIIKKTLEVTEPLETYIEDKLMPLEKFISSFEEHGEIELHLEVSRTSMHHHKGEEVYMACGELSLPGKTLRAEANASDIRKAIDEVRNILHMEIEKYKTKHSHPSEREK